jgi:hypothetical protein
MAAVSGRARALESVARALPVPYRAETYSHSATPGVPIQKFEAFAEPLSNFGIERTLANLCFQCGFGSEVRLTNPRRK